LAGKRAQRVGDEILKEIALLIIRRVKDPRVEGVTVTGMRLTDDLKQGKVYYSVMGGDEEIERAQAGLDSARGFIKREVGQRMKLRYVPEITFVHDKSLESGSHMERLLERIEAGRPGEGSEGTDS
jgi:ribosome-binding factor A